MKPYATNKKARFDYEILDTLEAGLVLSGTEVKSIRSGTVRLKGGFVSFHGNEAFLTNVHVPKYKHTGSNQEYDPEKSRKLLLKSKEIGKLREKSLERGLTIVPLSLYNSGRHIKLEIGVAKGKKKYDKRATLKKRDLDRETRRAIKN